MLPYHSLEVKPHRCIVKPSPFPPAKMAETTAAEQPCEYGQIMLYQHRKRFEYNYDDKCSFHFHRRRSFVETYFAL